MSASPELLSLPPSVTADSAARNILGPAGNREKIIKNESLNKKKKKIVVDTKPKSSVKLAKGSRSPRTVVRKIDVSVDSSCSLKSCSSNGSSSVKTSGSEKSEKGNGNRLKLVVDEGSVMVLTLPFKRCDWITQFSDPLHVSFHDEEWGVPVYEDCKLIELLVLSQASAELTWPEILYKREKFRKLFENFDPASIAKCSDDKLLSAKQNGSLLLSEQKLRAIMGNAIGLLKIQQEFGSFSTYCWRFLNKKPINNSFRYARQVPAKTPKSELISKDLIKRGFRCVGPTVIYTFMQISGMVNGHLISCFRHTECNSIAKKVLKPVSKETKQETDNKDDAKLSHE
ncbi:putative DNA-3-methyladenine glycosylase I [Helianthus annuus]|nr:putative DNA-3-methyladenine glycosylase I [Helianthus annuus]